jgi:hypothetical protein
MAAFYFVDSGLLKITVQPSLVNIQPAIVRFFVPRRGLFHMRCDYVIHGVAFN